MNTKGLAKRAHCRLRVAELLAEYGLLAHGVRARIARELGVHRSAVTRDVPCLLKERRACPCCGALRPREKPGA